MRKYDKIALQEESYSEDSSLKESQIEEQVSYSKTFNAPSPLESH